MDGLLGSEFALLLRDSLRSNNTPRRRINHPISQSTTPSSPISSMSPLRPPEKSPAISSIALRLNIDSNDTIDTFQPIPTSPTSPLPGHFPTTNNLENMNKFHSTCQIPNNNHNHNHNHINGIRSSSSNLFRHHLSSPSISSSSSSSVPTSPPASHSLPAFHFSPVSLSASSPKNTQPLDVLASVSAQQLDRKLVLTPTKATCSSTITTTTTTSSTTTTTNITNPSTTPSSPATTTTTTTNNNNNNNYTDKLLKSSIEIPSEKFIRKGSNRNSNLSNSNVVVTRKSQYNSGGKQFKCDRCPSTFSQQFNLNKHVRAVHERRRPFQCSVCHARFQQKSHRTMHHLAVHEKLRQFSCDRCPSSFSWRGVLKKHRKSIHGIDE